MRAAVARANPKAAVGTLTFERLAAAFSLHSVKARHRWAAWALAQLDVTTRGAP
jgi:hypothetical protein